jgi:predicted nucleotidyltransferase
VKLSSKEKNALDNLASLFRERFGAGEVILYGSAARDELDEGSDIDLLIVLPEVNWDIEKDIIRLCFAAELECGRIFSATCYSVDELEQSPLRFSPLVLDARKEGRFL